MNSEQVHKKFATHQVAEYERKPGPNCLVSMIDFHCHVVAKSAEEFHGTVALALKATHHD